MINIPVASAFFALEPAENGLKQSGIPCFQMAQNGKYPSKKQLRVLNFDPKLCILN